MARNDKKNGIIERAFGARIDRLTEASINRLFGAKIDDNGEFATIADIRNALIEIPPNLWGYEMMFIAQGSSINKNDLNNKGISERSIPYYVKYLSGCDTRKMFEAISDKVVSASTRTIVRDAKGEIKEEHATDIDKLKELDSALATYGRAAIFITNTGDTANELTFEVVEPYRYSIEPTRRVVFTLIGSYELDRSDHPLFEIIDARMQEDGTWYQTREHAIVRYSRRSKTNEVVRIELIEEAELKEPSLHEIHNTGKRSDLDSVKQGVLIMDMIETLRANEAKASQFSIHADQAYFDEGRVVKQDVYRVIDAGFSREDGPMYEAFQPDMRVEQYISYKADVMEGIARTLGVSTKAIGVPQVTHTKQTATAALLDEEKTAETINNRKSSIVRQFNAILRLYHDDSELILPAYVSQSLAFKAEIVKSMDGTMSVESKVDFLYPAWGEKDRRREVLLIKIEQNIPMTDEEKSEAMDIGLLGADTVEE